MSFITILDKALNEEAKEDTKRFVTVIANTTMRMMIEDMVAHSFITRDEANRYITERLNDTNS